MLHVDLVKNEWLAGWQLAVAKASVNAGGIHVDATEGPTDWELVLLRPFLDSETGDVLDPEKEPDRFLERVHTAIHGTYLFATDAHELGECPFEKDPVQPIRRAARQFA